MGCEDPQYDMSPFEQIRFRLTLQISSRLSVKEILEQPPIHGGTTGGCGDDKRV